MKLKRYKFLKIKVYNLVFSVFIMDEFIISGPIKEYSIQFEDLGKYLFDSLSRRSSSEIIAIDPLTKKKITCGEVLEKSVKLAKVLRKLSVQKGDVIVLISENNFNCFIVSCATLFCGAILLLVNYAYLSSELNHAFKLSNPKVIFSSKTALPHLLSVKKDIDSIESIISIDRNDFIDVQNIEDLINSLKNDDSFAPVVGNATDTAVLCLSSGTTGLPKCVELAHENFIPIMNNFWAADSLNITSKDTSVVFLPFFHIYGFLIHLAAITNSLTIIQMNSFKPDLFLQAIQDYKSTKLFIVPSILQFLVKSPMVSEFNLKSLEDIMVAAAPLSSDIYELAAQRFDTCLIRQLYGSSETGGVCIMQEGTSKRCNVGKVMCNTFIKVISIDTKINLGPYENGEICVKTLSVMKGYLNNPSETKNSFDIDGFYCTGDIGYYDSDNNFYIVDRIKELIKYKGFQVAPAELENILESHPEVRDCGVVGIEDEKCGELPLAFVVRQEGSKITADELIKYVAERISIQKQLHGGVRFVEEIPRTSSGKILRKEFKKMLIK